MKSGGRKKTVGSLPAIELTEEGKNEAKYRGTNDGGARNGQYPCEDDTASNAPANRGQAAGGADADDCARDGVRGADGYAEVRCSPQRQRTGSLRGESPERRELGDALAHGFDDAPAASHGAAAHGKVAADDDPIRDGVIFHEAASDKGSGDDTHAFLRVVGAVAEAVRGGRE